MRGFTAAGTADACVGTVNYWSDDHIQDALDRNRREIYREQLVPIPRLTSGGTVEYYEHRSAFRWLESTDGGTAVFVVEDGTGTDAGTASWSADYNFGKVTFTQNTAGTIYYLTARSYDIHRAAADIWRQKAAHYAKKYNVATDGHRLDRAGLIQNALMMADYYEAKSGSQVVEMVSE